MKSMAAVVKLEPVLANPAVVGDHSTAWLIRGCLGVLHVRVAHVTTVLYCTGRGLEFEVWV